MSYYNLANLYTASRRIDKAKSAYQQAIAIQEQLAVAHPTHTEYQVALGVSRNNLGFLYMHTSQWDLAERIFRDALNIWDSLVSKDPTAARHTFAFGESACNLGEVLRHKGAFEDSLKGFASAIQAFQTVLQLPKHDAAAPGYLANAYAGRALSLTELARFDEALEDWDRSLPLAPGHAHQQFRLLRAATLARKGDHRQAVAEAQMFTAAKPADLLYRAACVYSLASAAVLKDEAIPSPERDKLAGEYSARAVLLLRAAQAAQGFRDPVSVGQLKEDKDLEPVRSREDFKKLLAEVEAQLGTN